MSARSAKLAAVLGGIGLLTSCSSPRPAANTRTSDFYWAAAAETYAAGDYARTADNLRQLLDDGNPYTARAIPWYLVLTSGMSRGYMELADRYTAAARINKANALALNRKASQHRATAGRLALSFAQEIERLKQVPLGKISLAFSLPKGTLTEPPVLTRLGSGFELSAADQQAAEAVAVQRGVLAAVCLAAGAPKDIAKAREILGRPSADTTRETFAAAVASSLKEEAALFARDKLDDPEKQAAFQKRAELALAEGARVGSARIGLLVNASPAQ